MKLNVFKSMINLALVSGAVLLVLFLLEVLLRGQFQPDMNSPVDGTVFAIDVSPEMEDAFLWDGDGNSIAHIRSENRGMVYELRPGVELNEFIRINSHGFRDYEYDEEKPVNVFRICVIGDSITFGWWERLEQTYPKVLERLLNAHAADGVVFEVWNMGIGGYNAEQEMELFRSRALDFDPDMLIIGYCANDNDFGSDAGLWRHFTRSGSLAWDWISLRWLQARELWHRRTLVQRSYQRIADIAAREDLPVAVAFFHPMGAPEDWSEPIARDKPFAESLGFIVIDLLEVFEAYPWRETMNDHIHPNAFGHRLAGQAIFETLRSTGLLPLSKSDDK